MHRNIAFLMRYALCIACCLSRYYYRVFYVCKNVRALRVCMEIQTEKRLSTIFYLKKDNYFVIYIYPFSINCPISLSLNLGMNTPTRRKKHFVMIISLFFFLTRSTSTFRSTERLNARYITVDHEFFQWHQAVANLCVKGV